MIGRGSFLGVAGGFSIVDPLLTKAVYMVSRLGNVYEIIYSGSPVDLEVLYVKSEGRITFGTPFEGVGSSSSTDLENEKIECVYKL